MKPFLVTGATGLLGSRLVPFLRAAHYPVITHARINQADITIDLANRSETFRKLDHIDPQVIVNLVGLTSVDECEEHPHAAYLANTRTVENIVAWILEGNRSCHLLHISTDHVYDGLGPHSEAEVTLTNTYALTKYAGELAASRIPSTILRTSFVGRTKNLKRESLSDWLYNAMRVGRAVQVLNDVFFSPLSIHTLIQMIERVLEKRLIGTFNLGSRCGMSKADFDFQLAKCIGIPTATMSTVSRSELRALKAYRPRDMRMDSNRFEMATGVELPELIEEMKIIAAEYIGEA
jgi:dTDP-4-dehydrorhamnose reductase